jgi:hypothetical protein
MKRWRPDELAKQSLKLIRDRAKLTTPAAGDQAAFREASGVNGGMNSVMKA